MKKFEPLDISNLLYQIDGSHDVFGKLASTELPLNSGFFHSSVNRYMLTSNLIQYHCPTLKPVVLDYGCGAGSFKSFWDKNYQTGNKKEISYTGLEVNTAYVGEGIAAGHCIRYFDANNADIRTTDVPAQPDVVLMQQFAEHIDQRSFDYLLEYTFESLSSTGIFIVSSPNPSNNEKIMEHHHDYEYTLDEMIGKLECFGFRVVMRFGWMGFGTPNFDKLSDSERSIYDKLRFISDGYANSVMCMINSDFAPYYYLVLTK